MLPFIMIRKWFATIMLVSVIQRSNNYVMCILLKSWTWLMTFIIPELYYS